MSVPDQTADIERQVLAGLAMHFGAALDVLPVLGPECFTADARRLVFIVLREKLQAGQRVDPLIVLQDHRLRAATVDALEVADSLNGVCYPSHLSAYAQLLREKADLRAFNRAARQAVADSENPEGRKAGELLSELQGVVLGLGVGMETDGGLRPVGQDVDDLLDEIEDRATNPDRLLGIATGIPALDWQLQGLQAGDLIILAGASSMGKTTLALNIAENVAQETTEIVRLGGADRGRVLVFSLEMSRKQLLNRMICSLGGIDAQNLRAARLTRDEQDSLTDVAKWLRTAPLDIDGAGTLSVPALRARVLQARARAKISLVVVDYLGLLDLQQTKGENKADALGRATRALKMMAKDLQVPVLCLAQLNREVDKRPDKRPLMSDLRDSGSIVNDSDVILMVYRDEYYTKGQCLEPGVAEIIIEKQRNGPRTTVKARFAGENTRFSAIETPAWESAL